MTNRARLPDRRYHETVACEFQGQRLKIGLGRQMLSEDGHAARVTEVFISAQKPNSFVDAFASDGEILMSLALQHGCAAETIAHAMKRNADGTPATPLGLAADLLRNEE